MQARYSDCRVQQHEQQILAIQLRFRVPDLAKDHVGRPGRVTVFAQTPGPVVVLSRQQPQQADHLEDDQAAPLPAGGEWICELCMRKFGSEALLRRHEQISDLHRQNLAARGL
ncbi:unnamed protein product [Prorocentrum cordatum]|uniref:C2H2-type domain-containing protein n=1 Tax=Prorocentrum cordatum TaxID=2364126 RepID=A0ABN9Q665_9DINO|nr:unnamed protein product [Polarella glacialis]